LTAFRQTLERQYAEFYGPEFLLQQRGEPMTAQILARMLDVPNGTRIVGGGPYPTTVRENDHRTIMLRALWTTMSQSGVRKDEISLPKQDTPFCKARMSRWHLSWIIRGERCRDPSPDELRSLAAGDMAVLQVACAKNDRAGLTYGNHPVYLPFVPGDPLSAAVRLRQMELKSPVRGVERRRATPLFSVDAAGAQPVYHSFVETALRRTVASGAPEAKHITPHSFRIGLACALHSAGRPFAVIKALCRWKDDESVRTYARLTPDVYAGHLKAAREGASRAPSLMACNFPVGFLDEGAAIRAMADTAGG
jgi:hypothetical protein